MKLPGEFTIGQIATFIGGRVQGPADLKVSTVAISPLHATETDLAFAFDEKMVRRLDECKAAAVIVPEGTKADRPLILVERPTLAIQKMLSFSPPKRYQPEKGIHPTAIVDPTAEIAPDAAIGPLVVIGPKTKIGSQTKVMAATVIGGQVEIGEKCLIHPGCMISDFVKIGNRVTLQQGASIGPDGFGYVTERPSNMELRIAGKGIEACSDAPNPYLKIPQIGNVVLEDDVEIGSCATIDRATMGATTIGKGSKIDNQVMIAHNVRVGKDVVIVAHTAVAGSCTVGDRAVLSGHVAVTDHTNIGKDAIIEGTSGVMRDVPDFEVMLGIPATKRSEQLKSMSLYRKLPQMQSEIKDLKKRIAQLEQLLLERQLTK